MAIVKGNKQSNMLIGSSDDDKLFGFGGNDVLLGKAGRDLLNGGSGDDVLRGGLGNDIYIVDTRKDKIIETSRGGIDKVIASVTFNLPSNVENLVLTGHGMINGHGNDLSNTIVGNINANKLTGDDGNDMLNGGKGADTLSGGLGQDLYIVDNKKDVVIEYFKDNYAVDDTVKSSVSFTLAENVENLVLLGALAIDGTGNIFSNIIKGNSAANTLNSGGGKYVDWLYGYGGNDLLTGLGYLYGGDGDDTLEGSGRFNGGNGDDLIMADYVITADGGKGLDTLSIKPGNQTIYFSDLNIKGIETINCLGSANSFRLAIADLIAMKLNNKQLTINSSVGDLLFLEEIWLDTGIDNDGYRVLKKAGATVKINQDATVVNPYFLSDADSAATVNKFFTPGVDYVVIDFGGKSYDAIIEEIPSGVIDLAGFGLEDVLVIGKRDGVVVNDIPSYHHSSVHRASYLLQSSIRVSRPSSAFEMGFDRVSWKTGANTAKLISVIGSTQLSAIGLVASIAITGLPTGLNDSHFVFV